MAGWAIYIRYPGEHGKSLAEAVSTLTATTLPAIFASFFLWILVLATALVLQLARVGGGGVDRPDEVRRLVISIAVILGLGNVFCALAGDFFAAQVGRSGNVLGKWDLFSWSIGSGIVLLLVALMVELYGQFRRLEDSATRGDASDT